MELVEGPTLADRIAEGALPPEEALRIAKQIIGGLEAAHAQGIVHRDLKPANIKVKEDGLVKILDFGIAKPIDVAGISGSQTPTQVTPAVTETGVIMGTAAYMSPEQARGRFVDQRTDIWAFGCLLYEMLTGQPAFAGEDVMMTLARILDRDAELDSIPGMVSPAVRHTIGLCLRKEAKKRIGSIGDVRLAMEGEFESGFTGTGQVETAYPLWKKISTIAATAVISAGLTSLLFFEPTPENVIAEVRRSVHTLPPDQPLNFPVITSVSVASDDSRIVYAANAALYIRDMDELEGRLIPGTEGEVAVVPNFSPDGNWVAYADGANGTLKRISVEGGTALPILPNIPPNGYTWESDNTILYGSNNEIWRITASGGSPALIATDETGYDMQVPRRIPDTDWILFDRRSPDQTLSEVAVASISTGEITVLFPGHMPTYHEDGYLIYFENTLGLMARQFDPETLEYGSGIVLVSDILRMSSTGGGAQFNVSENGSLLYVKGEVGSSVGIVMMAIADEERVRRQLEAPQRGYQYPSVSPDGTMVAVQDAQQIYVYRLDDSSEIRQLTFEGDNLNPVWTPDGQFITYSSNRVGIRRIWQQRADGSGVAEPLTVGSEEQEQFLPRWAPDGRLTYVSPNEGGDEDIWVVSIPLGEPEVLVGGSGSQFGIIFSPNGSAMSYGSNESGVAEIFAAPFPPDGSSTRISEAGSFSIWPLWSSNGGTIYYQNGEGGGGFAAVDIALPGFALSNRRDLPYFGGPANARVTTLPDSDELFFTMPQQDTGAGGVTTELIFVENWIEEVKQRVPQDLPQ